MENRTVNMQENWIKCDVPKSQNEFGFTVTSIVQDSEGTKIFLEDEKIKVELYWDALVILRSSIESVRLRTVADVLTKYGNNSFFRGCFLYRVENSTFSDWVDEESYGVYEKSKQTHYCIVTSLDVIDVVASIEPAIKVTEL
jgi:hypothetical protein